MSNEKTKALNDLTNEFENKFKDLKNKHKLEINNTNQEYEQKISSFIKTHDNEMISKNKIIEQKDNFIESLETQYKNDIATKNSIIDDLN